MRSANENNDERLPVLISNADILSRYYLHRIEEITSHGADYHGIDPNLVAAIYERRLHKITHCK